MPQDFAVHSITMPASNIFGFESPENCLCRVWDYAIGHSNLTIEVKRDAESDTTEDTFYILFDSVLYFEGPMWWKSANFRSAEFIEYFTLLHKLQSSEKLDPDIQPHISEPQTLSNRLFKVQTINYSVKIIASHATKFNADEYAQFVNNDASN